MAGCGWTTSGKTSATPCVSCATTRHSRWSAYSRWRSASARTPRFSHWCTPPEPLNWTLLRGDYGGNVEISNGPSRSECQLALVHHVLQWKFDRQMNRRGQPDL